MSRRHPAVPSPSPRRMVFGCAAIAAVACLAACRSYSPSVAHEEAPLAAAAIGEPEPPAVPLSPAAPGAAPKPAEPGTPEAPAPAPAPPTGPEAERAAEEAGRAFNPETVLGKAAIESIGRTFAAVYFDEDSAELRFSARKAVDEYAQWLVQNPHVWVTLEGHSDAPGAREYNYNLAMRRVWNVKERMTGLGVDAERLFTISYGEDRPAAQGATAGEYSLNRRVEFLAFLAPNTGQLPSPSGPIPLAPDSKQAGAPPPAEEIK